MIRAGDNWKKLLTIISNKSNSLPFKPKGLAKNIKPELNNQSFSCESKNKLRRE